MGAICMYVCMYKFWKHVFCSVEVFLSLEKHFMKVVCCVKLSKLCPKVFVECHSFVFLGTICTIQSLFRKGYLSSSSYNHKKTEYLCTMRGCFWSVYLLFDLCTIRRHGCKFCWPSTRVVYVQSGCFWLCQSMRNFGITTNKWTQTFCERWQWHYGHNFRISHFWSFFLLSFLQ
jgi:hypothetical protein